MNNNYNRNNLNNNDKNNLFLLDRNFELNNNSKLNNKTTINYIDREYLQGVNTRNDDTDNYMNNNTINKKTGEKNTVVGFNLSNKEMLNVMPLNVSNNYNNSDNIYLNRNKLLINNVKNKADGISGEITGFNLNNNDIINGMPLRDNFKNINVNKDGNSKNKYLDFNIFNNNMKVENTDVKYNDTNKDKVSFLNKNVETNSDLKKKNKDDIIDLYNDLNCTIFSNFQESLGNRNILTIGTYSLLLNLLVLFRGSNNKTEKIFSEFFNNISKENLYNIVNEFKVMENDNFKMINLIYLSKKFLLNNSYKNYVSKLSKIYNIDKNDPYDYDKINKENDELLNKVSIKVLSNDILENKEMVMSNIIFFRTKFKIPFSRVNNSKKMFHSYKKKKLMTMMTIRNIVTEFYEDKYYKLIELECKEDRNIGFIIPKVFNCPALTWDRLSFYIKRLKRVVLGEITIPKFKDHCKFKIDNILKKMGLGSIYNNINITDIVSNDNDLKVDNVLHQILLIVDEGGVSNYNISDKCNNKKKFIADHPFIYYVRDIKSKMILIMGMYK